MSVIEKEFAGKTIEECVAAACDECGIDEKDLVYSIVQEEKQGFLGIGKKEAIIKVTIEKSSDDSQPEAEESAAEDEKDAEEVAENGEMPAKIYEVRDYLISIIKHIGVEDISIDIEPCEGGALFTLVCASDNKGNIIGKRGETLDALQYLASVVMNRDSDDYFRINIDSNGYREKRKETLERLAAKIGKNVLRSGRNNSLEPMNPYERRIIHSVISEMEGVSSHSVGEEPYRRVIITCDNPKPRNNYRKSGSYNSKGSYKGGQNAKGGYKGSNRGDKGGYKKNNGKYRNDDNYVPKRKSMDSMKTSFEKEYSKPKPEDNIDSGLYGKIEF